MIANRADALLPQNYGWRLENIVYIELLRRAAPLFHDIFYYKPSSRSKEVDFVICEQGKVIELVQVAYEIDSPKTFKRETEALIQASEKIKCNNLTLIAKTETRDETISNRPIHIYSITDWLLDVK